MKNMNRRRFLSVLTLAGLYATGRSQTDTEVPDEDKTYYYECKTRLLRGKIPDISGSMRSTGYPSRLSVEATIELAPESLRFPSAKIGRFATSQEQQKARVFQYTAARIRIFRDTAEEARPNYWGDEANGYVHAGFIEMQLSPYLVDAAVTYPLSMTLRVGGKDLIKAEATNVVVSGFEQPLRDIRATLDAKDGDALTMNQVMNDIEKAKGFEVDVTDAAGRLLVRLPFRTASNLAQARRWVVSEVDSHRNAMISDACPRIEKATSSSSGSGGAGCFITTAAVGAVGLSDDCWELATLRRFRDTVLLPDADGRQLVADYYRLAPAVVERVNRRPDALSVWLKTYWLGIVPCAVFAKIGCNRLAVSRYRALTQRLAAL